MLKLAARKFFLEKRKSLTASECLKKDDLLLIQFQKLHWNTYKCVANFYPIEKNNEPNSLLFTRYLKAMVPDIQIVYPVINVTTATIAFHKETEQTITNAWGIQEPMNSPKVEPVDIDAVIVPLLGFDEKGHRVGYGKGFYDKYFENFSKHKPRMGVCYFEPITKIEDTREFDVPLTHCITPWNNYEF